MTLMHLDPPEWGPWVGVPEEQQRLCAVVGCEQEGRPQQCCTDGAYHHHGCVHYDLDWLETGLTFRKGWGWLCNEHYDLVKQATPRLGERRSRARA